MSNNSNVSGNDNCIDRIANKCVWKNQRFQKFYSQSLHCDITLSTSSHLPSSRQEVVKAHKIILAEASPYFHKVLGQRKFLGSSGKHFPIPSIEKIALEHLITFIYTGTLSLSHENLLTVFHGSKLLELEEATRKCEMFLVEGLNTENVWQRFQLCKEMGSINLPKIISYIKNSWDIVIPSKDFLELAYMDIMALISNTREERAPSVFQSIKTWINHNEGIRKHSLVDLLKLIPLKAIPAKTLVEFFYSPNLKDIPGFLEYALQQTVESVCLLEAQIISCSQQTPVQRNNLIKTSVQEEVDTDDVIFVPTSPKQTTATKSENVSRSPFPISGSLNPAPVPSQFSTPKPGIHRQDFSPGFLSRKRILQEMRTQCCKKSRPDITATDESMLDFKNTPSRGNDRFTHSNRSVLLQGGRIICINDKNSLETFDIRMTSGFEVVDFINQIPDCLHEGGRNACLIYYCDKVYNIGGVSEGEVATKAVLSYDFVRNKWKAETKLVLARFNHTVVEFEGNLYAIGGSTNRKNRLNSVERLVLGTGKPSRVYEVHPMTYPREAHGTAVFQNKIYAIGGFSQESNGSDNCLDAMECYDSKSKQWNPRASMKSKRCGMAVAVFMDKLYVIGGGNELKAKKKLQSVEVYNFKTDKWSYTKPLSHPRQYGSAVVLDGNLYVIGGDCSSNPTVEVFRPHDKKWEVVSGVLNNQCFYSSIAVKS